MNMIPYAGVDAGESIQVSKVRRSDGDGIAKLAGEGRLASEDRNAVERTGIKGQASQTGIAGY
jgi:hypothetical protein